MQTSSVHSNSFTVRWLCLFDCSLYNCYRRTSSISFCVSSLNIRVQTWSSNTAFITVPHKEEPLSSCENERSQYVCVLVPGIAISFCLRYCVADRHLCMCVRCGFSDGYACPLCELYCVGLCLHSSVDDYLCTCVSTVQTGG